VKLLNSTKELIPRETIFTNDFTKRTLRLVLPFSSRHLKDPKYYVPALDILNQVSFSWLFYLDRITLLLTIQYFRQEMGAWAKWVKAIKRCLSS